MKLAAEPRNIERSEAFKTTQFKILATAKAFEILSSGLYSDKPRAVIRELSTNAYDAHVAAGNLDKPFVVNLPNRYSSEFSIRDYGTGLSEKDIIELYTTYFASNKTESDDFVGCMGLGSKSPFSYVQQFSVTSFYNKVKSIYSCYIDENGEPAIAPMHKEETEEENGLLVTIPVQPHDYYEFHSKALNVYKYFKFKPTLLGGYGGLSLEPESPQYLLEEDGKFGVHNTETYSSHVIMGNVAYSIKAEDFTDPPEGVKTLLRHGIDLYLPIGSVDIAASREQLSYKGRTTKIVLESLNYAVEQIGIKLREQIEDAENLWEAKLAYNECSKNIIGKVGKVSDMEWQGIPIDEERIYRDKYTKRIDKQVADDPNNPTLLRTVCETIHPCERMEELDFSPKRRSRYSDFSKTCSKSIATTIPITRNIEVYINDLPRGGYANLEGWMKQNNIKQNVYVLTNPTKEFLEESGLIHIVKYTSSLPSYKVERAKYKREKKEYHKIHQYNYISGYGNSNSDYWEAVDKDAYEGGVYVLIKHFKTDYGNNKSFHSPYNIGEVYQLLRRFVKGGFTLYGIREKDLPFLQKRGKWIRIEDYVKQQVVQYPDLLEACALRSCRNRIDNFNIKTLIDLINVGLVIQDPVFDKIADLYNQCQWNGDDGLLSTYEQLAHIAHNFDLNISLSLLRGEIDYIVDLYSGYIDQFYEKYPLLSLVNYYHDNSKLIPALQQYFDSIKVLREIENQEAA